MWRSFYENAELLELPLASMLLFFVTFTTAALLAWRHGKNDPRAALPLADDQGGAR